MTKHYRVNIDSDFCYIVEVRQWWSPFWTLAHSVYTYFKTPEDAAAFAEKLKSMPKYI